MGTRIVKRNQENLVACLQCGNLLPRRAISLTACGKCGMAWFLAEETWGKDFKFQVMFYKETMQAEIRKVPAGTIPIFGEQEL